MQAFLKRLTWIDYAILAVLLLFVGYVWLQIEGTLNYKWRWHLIPNYILRWHTGREEWFANLLLQGLVTTSNDQLGSVRGMANIATILPQHVQSRFPGRDTGGRHGGCFTAVGNADPAPPRARS